MVISCQALELILAPHSRVNAKKYEAYLQDQVHLLMHCSLSVLRDGKAPIHAAKQIQEWFREHQGEFQHLHGQIFSYTRLRTCITAFLGELKMLERLEMASVLHR